VKTEQTATRASQTIELERPAAPRGLELYLRALWMDKVVLVAFMFVLLVVFSAIFADFVAPHDPYAQVLSMRERGYEWVDAKTPQKKPETEAPQKEAEKGQK
jgi:hypothetical protein